jgi:hypothetical protein
LSLTSSAVSAARLVAPSKPNRQFLLIYRHLSCCRWRRPSSGVAHLVVPRSVQCGAFTRAPHLMWVLKRGRSNASGGVAAHQTGRIQAWNKCGRVDKTPQCDEPSHVCCVMGVPSRV